jgi:plasmid stability protein
MATVSIELDEGQARRLKELAAAARRSEQDLAREALQQYLQSHERRDKETGSIGFAALRAMIGLVKDGPSGLSLEHDLRPGDTP